MELKGDCSVRVSAEGTSRIQLKGSPCNAGAHDMLSLNCICAGYMLWKAFVGNPKAQLHAYDADTYLLGKCAVPWNYKEPKEGLACICRCVCICICMCMYTYIHLHTYIHTFGFAFVYADTNIP